MGIIGRIIVLEILIFLCGLCVGMFLGMFINRYKSKH